jgi:hypothetical protein
MSEKYHMSEAEKIERENIKALHQKLRAPLRGGGGDRHDMLAWAFVRGFKYRRCERSCRIQTCGGLPADMFGKPVEPGQPPYVHNRPSARMIWERLVRAGVFPHRDVRDVWLAWERVRFSDEGKAVQAWLDDPSGAIAAPVRQKKLYVPVAAE